MPEKPYFLHADGERLFAFLHLPEGKARAGVVLCSPLAEEKLWSHRVFVSFARDLARAGYAVLRFDFRCEGDSDRRFEEASLTTRVEDTHLAVEEMRRHLAEDGRVTLAGLRLGASIAALAAADRDDIHRLVLWEPVTNGGDYVQAILRANLMQQMTQHRRVVEDRESLMARLERGESVNVEGYALGGPLFLEISRLRLAEVPARATGGSLVVSIAAREAAVRPDLEGLSEAWGNTHMEIVNEEPFWREIRKFYGRAPHLFDVTTRWLGAP